jgi:SAM-dependent methyltransferase
MMARDVRDPQTEIAAGNPWYVEDQFATQLGAPAFRAVVENRWRTFTAAIDTWAAQTRRAPTRILDAGCGDGINLTFLARLNAERGWTASLFGADYSVLRVDRAQALGTARLVRTSVTALAFEAAAFDIVLCNQVLEHVPDLSAALAELRRVIAPGGLLLVGVPNEGSPLGWLRNHVLQRSILHTTDHVNMFTRTRLSQYLQQAGFVIREVTAEGFFTPHTTLHSLLYGSQSTRRVLEAITRLFPTLAAGLLVAAERPVT